MTERDLTSEGKEAAMKCSVKTLRRAGALLALCLAAGCQFRDNPPNAPLTPTGPTDVPKQASVFYYSSANDPDGDSVYLGLNFTFGDATPTENVRWSRLVGSGDTVSVFDDFWKAGTFRVRMRALDVHGYYSDWSQPLTVTVTEERKSTTPSPAALRHVTTLPPLTALPCRPTIRP
jgi:hypothetical protein